VVKRRDGAAGVVLGLWGGEGRIKHEEPNPPQKSKHLSNICVIAKNQSTENPTELNMEATDGDMNQH
jgi:hypothetical protein